MRRFFGVSAAVCLLMLLCGCAAKPAEKPARTGFALDTVVTVTLYDVGEADADKALSAAFAEITRLEALLSVTVPTGDVFRLNEAAGQPVTVAHETAEVLRLAQRVAEKSGGAFDITVRPVSALWDFTAGVIPDTAALQAAAATVDYRHLTVEGTTVTLSEGAIDLGGVAKGYIADRVAAVLKECGVKAAMIDLGGNLVALGDKQGEAFRMGIKNPAAPDSLCAIVEGRDVSVVTSGTYERGFDKDGVRYHHLLDPATGLPVQNTLASVTVVCASSAEADALSTACFVLGEQDGMALIRTIEGAQALFVRQDGTLLASDGLSYRLP